MTWQSAIAFDADDPDAGLVWSQRIALAADASPASELRLRAALVSALAQGGDQTGHTERNVLDVQEAYAEFGPANAFMRVGRQEIRLGSQRRVAVRDGTTVRRTWDGVRGHGAQGAVMLDAFALRLVAVRPRALWTSVCIVGPALSALDQGYWVYVIADACGDVSDEAHARAMDRMVQAGARPLTALQHLRELQRDWARAATYGAVTGTAMAHGGASGLGIIDAKSILGADAHEG